MTGNRRAARVAALACAIALLAANADGALKLLEQAWEAPLGAVTLPGSESGQLVLRRCAGCEPEILRATPATRYFVHPSRAPVSLRDARQAAVRAGASPAALVYVYYEPATRNVRRVVLDPGPANGRAGR